VRADAVAIRKVWDSVPSVGCTGACADYCTAIGMSEGELELVRERIPSFPDSEEGLRRLAEDPAGYKCPALVLGRCAVYDVRPTVCRIFGNAETLPCPHGCEPPKLTQQQASAIMDAAREAGGPLA
jgi:Fe-S-cluster containining protein